MCTTERPNSKAIAVTGKQQVQSCMMFEGGADRSSRGLGLEFASGFLYLEVPGPQKCVK